MKTFIIFPILGLIPFYLGLPWVNKKVDEYLMNNAYYGEKQFKIDIQTKHTTKLLVHRFSLCLGLPSVQVYSLILSAWPLRELSHFS